jgi:hypothetical protein
MFKTMRKNMKNKMILLGSVIGACALVLSLSYQAKSQSNAAQTGPNTPQSERAKIRQKCMTDNHINVDFKAGEKLNASQLATMDKCMRVNGIKVGKRAANE